MFKGEESVRVRTSLPLSKMEEIVDDAVRRLGKVQFFGKSEFEVSGSRYSNFASEVFIDGQIRSGRKSNEWIVQFDYEVKPTTLCWVIAVVGFFMVFFGPAIFLMPFLAKGEVEKAVRLVIRDIEDDAEA